MENIDEIKYLLEKYLNHKASASERMDILRWVNENEELQQWIQDQIGHTNNDINPELKDKIYERICADGNIDNPNVVNKTSFGHKYIYLSIAACLVAIVSLMGWNYIGQPINEKPLSIYTNTGNRSNVTLPDGSVVWLNSLSKISYFYDAKNRERIVKLSGEAYFDVAKDKAHPFNVLVGDIKVECKGTKFNISAYSDDKNIDVILAEGRVIVSSENKSIDLHPNMMASFDKSTGILTKEKVNSRNYCEWMNGYIYFDNESFTDISKIISRNYGITVNILSPQLKDERFTGSIYQGDIKKILNVLSAASGAKYELISDSVVNLSY